MQINTFILRIQSEKIVVSSIKRSGPLSGFEVDESELWISEWKMEGKRQMLAEVSVAPLCPGVKEGVHPWNTDGITQAIL